MAKNKVTGEQFLFSFTDLSGYEGELRGIIFRDGMTVFGENTARAGDQGRGCVLNPDLEIRLARIEDRNCLRIK